jgi:hypothetical protein
MHYLDGDVQFLDLPLELLDLPTARLSFAHRTAGLVTTQGRHLSLDQFQTPQGRLATTVLNEQLIAESLKQIPRSQDMPLEINVDPGAMIEYLVAVTK